MTLRLLLLASCVPLAALAELQLNVVENRIERPVTGLYDVGAIQVGETLDTKFRIRNTGTASVTLQTLIVAGVGFRATGYPSLPYIVAPGTNVDFTVRFNPANFGTYSASLSLNAAGVLLRGVATAGALLSSNGTALASGAAIDFGLVERGFSSSRHFTLQNTTSGPVSLQTISVTGSDFRGPSGISLPLQLAPNAEASFDVAFEPAASGIAQGALLIDGRSFSLTGSSNEPTFPRPVIVLDSAALASGKQGRVAVHLSAASRAIGDGKLRLDFQPAAGLGDNDTGIQFLSGGSRTLSFHVAQGDTDVSFEGAPQAVFQTGTTAGTIVFTVEVGGYKEQLTAVVTPSVVQIDSAKAVRNGSTLEVQIAGFDNTRTLSQMSFTFFDSAGQPVAPGAIRLDAAADFRRYFDASNLGGVFSVKAVFPVSGNAAGITGVEVQFQNASGSAATQRLRL